MKKLFIFTAFWTAAQTKLVECKPDLTPLSDTPTRGGWDFCTKMAFGHMKTASWRINALHKDMTPWGSGTDEHRQLSVLVFKDDHWDDVLRTWKNNRSKPGCDTMKHLASFVEPVYLNFD